MPRITDLPREVVDIIGLHTNDLVVAWNLKCSPYILNKISKNKAKYGRDP